MREIEFRAKTVKSDKLHKIKMGQWMYGNLCVDKFTGQIDIEDTTNYDIVREQCDKNSIGQYSGHMDICGNKIYEKDIVQYLWDADKGSAVYGEVIYDDGCFRIKENDYVNSDILDRNTIEICKLIVVGNMIDSPQLIK